MSKIADELSYFSNFEAISIDDIFDAFTVKDIKEYVIYLQNENNKKDKIIYSLIVDKTTLQAKQEMLSNNKDWLYMQLYF